MDSYLLLKSLHIFGVTIFLGNIIVTALWKVMADKTRSPAIVAYAQRLVTITDFVFTTGGVILIITTGTMMAAKFGKISEVYWISWGLWLFIASGIIWVAILIPIQIMQAKMAKQFAYENDIPQKYWRMSKIWIWIGITATVLPIISLYFMVFKPL